MLNHRGIENKIENKRMSHWTAKARRDEPIRKKKIGKRLKKRLNLKIGQNFFPAAHLDQICQKF